MKLTQIVEIHPNEETDAVLTNLSKITNGLYNVSLYENNQQYAKDKKFVFYEGLCERLKDNELCRLLPSQSAQAIFQKTDGALKSFISLRKNGRRPEFPHYHKKNMEWLVPWKSQQIKLRKNKVTLPMSLGYRKQTGISYIHFRIPKARYEGKLTYLEISRTEGKWIASLVFDVQEKGKMETSKRDNLYIDLGVKNLAAVYDGKRTTLYKGGLAAMENQYKDKKVAQIQSILATHKKRTSREKREISRKAKRRIKQQIHAMTSKIVQTAKNEKKGIVIGDLSGIRENMHFRKKTNQKVHEWTFGECVSQIEYKAKMEGVRFRKVSEKDTSKTCALCGKKENGRIHRGLYRCKLYNAIFNADAGGALNIMKKYLRIPLSKGSGIGVVDALAHPAVLQWNEHEWHDESSTRVYTSVMIP